MVRILLIGVLALVALIVAWTIFTSLLHALMLGLWFVIAVLIGFGLYRVISWSRRGSRRA